MHYHAIMVVPWPVCTQTDKAAGYFITAYHCIGNSSQASGGMPKEACMLTSGLQYRDYISDTVVPLARDHHVGHVRAWGAMCVL